MVANITITDLPFHEEPLRGQPLPTGPGFTKLWPIVQALWAAGERDWLAPFLVKSVIEVGHLDALLRQPFGSRCLVAADGEQLVGFAWLVGQRVVSLWVMPAMRRRGIGRQLIDAAKASAQRAGYPFVEIEYPAGNKAAVAFCRALGFRPASRRTVEIDGRRFGSGIVFTLLARKYTHPRWVRALPPIGVAVFAYCTILGALDGEAWRATWFFLVVTLAMAANMLWTELVVWSDVDGLYGGYLNGRLRHMAWADLRAIDSDLLGQTFALRGEHGKIRASSTMTDIAWLFDTIRLARPNLWRKSDRRVFRIRPIWPIVLLAFSVGWWAFLAVAAIYGPGGAGWQWLLLAMLGIYPFALLLRRPYRLQIEEDALRVRYLRREELIPATVIAHVWAQRAGMVAISDLALELHLVDGRRINLSGFEGGVGELANTLVAWWQRVQGDVPES
jgi:ribosomal protein S18 acetylase RimI-like enzyme